jgi:VWFA-related protein
VKSFRTTFVLLVILTVVLSFTLSAQTQENQDGQSKSEAIKLNIDLVTLDAQVVQQKTDRIAWKLKQDDFILYEDGIKQKITNFSQDTLPLSVILLIDRVGSMDPFRDEVKDATAEIIKTLRPDDQVAVMTFSKEVTLFQPFGVSKEKIAHLLDFLPDPEPTTHSHCFNRAFYDAAHYMRKSGNPNGRRIIVLISAINESGNCAGPSTEETTNEVLESGSTVCAMLVKDKNQMPENIVKHGVAKMSGAGAINAKSLIEETGGELVDGKPKNFEFQFDNLITRLRTRYAIGFVSSNTKHDGSYRKLKLEITPETEQRQGKLVVTTRRGYIAAKQEEAK